MSDEKIVEEWFHRVSGGGLVLPDGWFGRPYDNIHRLKEVIGDGRCLTVILDGGGLILKFTGEIVVNVSDSDMVIEFDGRLLFRWRGAGSEVWSEQWYDGGLVKIVVPPGL